MNENENKILDSLLMQKEDIAAPQGFETKVMRRIFAEEAQPNRSFTFWNIKALSAYASVVILVSVFIFYNQQQVNDSAVLADAVEIIELKEDAAFYRSATNVFSEVNLENAIDKDIEDIETIDSAIDMLSS